MMVVGRTENVQEMGGWASEPSGGEFVATM